MMIKSTKDIYNELGTATSTKPLSQEDLHHLQRVLAECYFELQEVCERNGIRIMLGGGSCLGAIRHRGFIPWDDDLDTMMPRADYERFTHIFERELGDKYELEAPNYSAISSNRFPKVMLKGTRFVSLNSKQDESLNKIKIDIFIIENVPHDKLLRFIHGMFCQLLMFVASSAQISERSNREVWESTKHSRQLRRNRVFIAFLFGFRSAQQWFNTVDRACRYRRETGMSSIPAGRQHYFGEMQPTSTFLPLSSGTFEGHRVNLPNKPVTYLEKLYGADYMQLPPEEKREKHYVTEIGFGEY